MNARDAGEAIGNNSPIGDPLGESLSDEGAARRDAILGVVLRAQATRRTARARRARATAALAIVALGLAATVVALALRPAAPLPSTMTDAIATSGGGSPAAAGGDVVSGSMIVRLAGDPSALDRARITGNGRTQLVDDETLLDLLQRAGRPSGIIRIDGRATLTANTVADTQPAGRSG